MNRADAREAVGLWINDELVQYADKRKWDRSDANHTSLDHDTYVWWEDFVLQYVSRARVLEGTPAGDQALLKAAVTLFEMCVTMYVARNGEVPAPGHPSGEIVMEDHA